ncbi:MAG TPA: TetR/AcrR family transcriptional regulator [Planctomycetota bacterium]
MARNNGTDLRRAILDVSRRLLVEQGYDQLSMRKIASQVGCTATSIYLHFRNKDDLMHTLIDEGMEMLYANLSASAEGTTDPMERLERLGRAYLDFGIGNPEYYEVMFLLHPKHMERYPAEKYRSARRNLQIFAETLGQAHAAAVHKQADFSPQIAATLVWSTLHGLVSILIAQRVDVSVDREALYAATVARLSSYASNIAGRSSHPEGAR